MGIAFPLWHMLRAQMASFGHRMSEEDSGTMPSGIRKEAGCAMRAMDTTAGCVSTKDDKRTLASATACGCRCCCCRVQMCRSPLKTVTLTTSARWSACVLGCALSTSAGSFRSALTFVRLQSWRRSHSSAVCAHTSRSLLS